MLAPFTLCPSSPIPSALQPSLSTDYVTLQLRDLQGFSLLIYQSASSSALHRGSSPVLQKHRINSLIPNCSSTYCLLLGHIPCLIFPVTTSTRYFRCHLLHEVLLDLLHWKTKEMKIYFILYFFMYFRNVLFQNPWEFFSRSIGATYTPLGSKPIKPSL